MIDTLLVEMILKIITFEVMFSNSPSHKIITFEALRMIQTPMGERHVIIAKGEQM